MIDHGVRCLLGITLFAILWGCTSEGPSGDDASIPEVRDASDSGDASPSVESICTEASRHLAECLGDAPPSEAPNPSCDVEHALEILGLTCEQLESALPPTEPERRDSRLADISCSLRIYRFCEMSACDAEADEPEHMLAPLELPEDASDCARSAVQYEGCGACEYYRCREATAHCGPEGYLMNYAYRYCQRFRLVAESQMSPAGQAWFRRVRRCLITTLDAVEQGNDCSSIEEIGFRSHPECYIQTGFCELPTSDWVKVFNTVDPDDLRFRELLTAGNGCFRDWF